MLSADSLYYERCLKPHMADSIQQSELGVDTQPSYSSPELDTLPSLADNNHQRTDSIAVCSQNPGTLLPPVVQVTYPSIDVHD